MAAKPLAGEPVATAVLQNVKQRVTSLSRSGQAVGLGVILVGDDPASAGYVRKKQQACADIGIAFHLRQVASTASQAELLTEVDRLNRDAGIDGFLIQHQGACPGP